LSGGNNRLLPILERAGGNFVAIIALKDGAAQKNMLHCDEKF
jgi:hypothetical protein